MQPFLGWPICLPRTQVRAFIRTILFNAFFSTDRALNQKEVDEDMNNKDIMYNTRNYPLDEASAAYKDFNEVCLSVEQAKLAKTVCNLRARFVLKDSGPE